MDKRKLHTDSHKTNTSHQMDLDYSNFLNPKEEGAKILQRSLSCIMAKHFLDCWDELKNSHYASNLYGADPINMIKRRQDAGYTLDAIEKNKSIWVERKQLPHENRSGYFQEQTEGLYLQNPQIALSRANLLHEIVNKLNYPKGETSHEEVDMMKKIYQLQTMINDINEGQETKDQSPQLIEMISNEIKSIRNEIHSLKLTNQEFIRKEPITNPTQTNSHIFSQNHFSHQPIHLLNTHRNQVSGTNHPINIPLQNSINFVPPRAQSQIIEERKIIPQPPQKQQSSYLPKMTVLNKKKFSQVRQQNKYMKLRQIPAISTVKEMKVAEYEKPTNFPTIERYEPRFSYQEIKSEGSQVWCGENMNCFGDNFL